MIDSPSITFVTEVTPCNNAQRGIMSCIAKAMYFASVVLNATWDCNYEAQSKGHLANRTIYPKQDLTKLGFWEVSWGQIPEKSVSM